MTRDSSPSVMVLGYGNPGRQDDALGPRMVEELEALGLPGVETDANYQLNIEDAAMLADYEVVIFVDASINRAEPYEFRRVKAASEITFTTHSVSPESVLAICEDHFGGHPQAWILGIRAYEFEFMQELTTGAQANLRAARSFIESWIRDLKEKGSNGTERHAQTDDSHH